MSRSFLLAVSIIERNDWSVKLPLAVDFLTLTLLIALR